MKVFINSVWNPENALNSIWKPFYFSNVIKQDIQPEKQDIQPEKKNIYIYFTNWIVKCGLSFYDWGY